MPHPSSPDPRRGAQFNFLYSGWRNERFALEPIRDFFVLGGAVLGLGVAGDVALGGALLEGTALEGLGASFAEFVQPLTQIVEDFSSML